LAPIDRASAPESTHRTVREQARADINDAGGYRRHLRDGVGAEEPDEHGDARAQDPATMARDIGGSRLRRYRANASCVARFKISPDGTIAAEVAKR
jgi:hypothetical protein